MKEKNAETRRCREKRRKLTVEIFACDGLAFILIATVNSLRSLRLCVEKITQHQRLN